MSETNERSVASTGSVEPVAFAVYSHWHSTPHIAKNKQEAHRVRRGTDWIAPLYLHPQLTLTGAERREVEAACNFYSHECETDGATDDDYQNAAALGGLLNRTK